MLSTYLSILNTIEDDHRRDVGGALGVVLEVDLRGVRVVIIGVP